MHPVENTAMTARGTSGASATVPAPAPAGKVGWRVTEWCAATGLGRTTVWELVASRRIASVMVGRARIITTAPAAFLAALAAEAAGGAA